MKPARSRRAAGAVCADVPTSPQHPTAGSAPLGTATMGAPDSAVWLVGVATIVWAVVVDQGTKLWAGAGAHGVEVLHNPGGALGVVSGSVPMLLLSTVAILALFAMVIVPLGFRFGLPAWIPGLVLGGALSNMIDRVRFGGVRDFISTRWAIINVADLCVIAGVLILPALLAIRSWREYQYRTD